MDTRYLFRRGDVWWVKIAVPPTLRSELGYDLRRSLHTHDLEEARIARDLIVPELRDEIAATRERYERGCRAEAAPSPFQVTRREDFSDVTFLLEIHHPRLARAAEPGQFVLVLSHGHGERVPLTIADFDRDGGTVTVVVQAVGKTTREMQQHCQVGTELYAVVGPLGRPADFRGATKAVCVGGGLGVAPVYPQARALKERGAYVIGVVGFRNRDLVFWEDKFRSACDELIICTDDGSAGIKGLVTLGLEQAIAAHDDVDRVIAIGPPVMMRACAEATRPHGIPTVVSLNPIMVDGTGMCGGCRVRVGDEMRFACVDGPEFDGHGVDFTDLMGRQRRFVAEEKQALDVWSDTRVGATAT
jgi:sulfide dehydrogenase subunit beta